MIRRDFIKSLGILTAAVAAGINPLKSEVSRLQYLHVPRTGELISINYIGNSEMAIIRGATADEIRFDGEEVSMQTMVNQINNSAQFYDD